MLRGDEPSYQIGSQSFTEKEWDRFLVRFDALEEKIRERLRAAPLRRSSNIILKESQKR